MTPHDSTRIAAAAVHGFVTKAHTHFANGNTIDLDLLRTLESATQCARAVLDAETRAARTALTESEPPSYVAPPDQPPAPADSKIFEPPEDVLNYPLPSADTFPRISSFGSILDELGPVPEGIDFEKEGF